jgi:hypothetical protein
MILPYPILLAGLASISQAILLPPTVSSTDKDIVNALPYEIEAQVSEKNLDLDCSGCPVATWEPSGIVWVQGIESKLQLQFSIQHNDVDALYLNGLQIYPTQAAIALEPLGAVQLVRDKDVHTIGFLRLGYELRITPVVKSEQDQLELIDIHLQIVEIADKFVDGLESVQLKLLKTSTGQLMIGDLETAPTTNPGGKDCNTLVCQLKKIITDKLSLFKSTKGCGSKAGHQKARPGSSPNSHYHQQHHHHKHHGLGRILHALKRIALHVLVPIFVGIVAGFTASLLGLIVGQAIVFLWRKLYRRGQKGSYSKVQQKEFSTKIAEATEDESKSFLEHQDPPPKYENIVEDEKTAE